MLVSAALLGTARRPVDPAVLPDSVRRLVNGDDPEHTLLTAAALLTGYRRAGRLPERGVTVLSPAPADPREVVGPAAAYRLAVLLFGDRGNLLPEWLAAVSARGLRVPPERLPVLADAARNRPELRAALAEAAGPRGPWLAALQPDWAFLAERTDTDDPEVWTFGTIGQRRVWLAAVRSTDPGRARAALSEVWPAEPAPVRVQLLEVLRNRLSISDEEFLEAALDDRARDVRRLAAELLAALPESALSRRMADRLRPLLGVRRRTLVVALPAQCDEGMRRDGVNPVPPRGVGERAWWLGQLVSAAPLPVWAGLGSPAELVRMPVEGCDPRLLGLGWSAAAVREGATDWVHALLDGEIAIGVDQVAALVTVLPPAGWAPVIERWTRDQLPAGLLHALPSPWPVPVGNLVLDRIAAQRNERRLAQVADLAAYAVPPECLNHPLIHQSSDADAAPWRRRLLDTLVFRRAMYEELT